jgi:hypothetical protein
MLAPVERGHSLTMLVVRLTVYPTMNQSPVLAAARVAVDLLPRQCANLVLCVSSHSKFSCLSLSPPSLTYISNRGRTNYSRVK